MIQLEILTLQDAGAHLDITCDIRQRVDGESVARMSLAPLSKLRDFKVVDQFLRFPSETPLPRFDEAFISSDLDIKFRNHIAYQKFTQLVGKRLHVQGRMYRLSINVALGDTLVRVHDLSAEECFESPYLTFAWRLVSGNWEGLTIGNSLGAERHAAWRLAQQYFILRWLTGILPQELSWNHKRQALELNEFAGTSPGLVRLKELAAVPGAIPGIELTVAGESRSFVIHAAELARLPLPLVREFMSRIVRAGRTPPIELLTRWTC